MNVGRPCKEETKKKISKKLMGHKVSEKERKKFIERMTGRKAWNSGTTGLYSKEHREKIGRCHRKGKNGECITPENKRIRQGIKFRL